MMSYQPCRRVWLTNLIRNQKHKVQPYFTNHLDLEAGIITQDFLGAKNLDLAGSFH